MASIEKRTSKDNEVTYRVKVRIKGRPVETATFNRLTDAKLWAQQTEADIRRGKHFKTSEAKKRTLNETIDRYYKDVLSLAKNPTNQKTYLNWWKKEIGAYSLSDITTAIIVEKRNELVGSTNKFGRLVGPTTANRYTQALGHVFTIAIKEFGWISENPISNIGKYKESRGRVRCLSDEERKKILAACKESENPYLYTIVVLALSTGGRKMEIVGLKWSDIDLDRQRIILQETKNGERRVLPLQGHAFQLIKQLSAETIKKEAATGKKCEYVFPSAKACQPIDIRRAWEYSVQKAKLEDFRFHDLRHSAASYLAMNGASIAEIAEVLGHKTLQMVKRYAHLSEPHTSAVVASMNKRIFDDGQ